MHIYSEDPSINQSPKLNRFWLLFIIIGSSRRHHRLRLLPLPLVLHLVGCFILRQLSFNGGSVCALHDWNLSRNALIRTLPVIRHRRPPPHSCPRRSIDFEIYLSVVRLRRRFSFKSFPPSGYPAYTYIQYTMYLPDTSILPPEFWIAFPIDDQPRLSLPPPLLQPL